MYVRSCRAHGPTMIARIYFIYLPTYLSTYYSKIRDHRWPMALILVIIAKIWQSKRQGVSLIYILMGVSDTWGCLRDRGVSIWLSPRHPHGMSGRHNKLWLRKHEKGLRGTTYTYCMFVMDAIEIFFYRSKYSRPTYQCIATMKTIIIYAQYGS